MKTFKQYIEEQVSKFEPGDKVRLKKGVTIKSGAAGVEGLFGTIRKANNGEIVGTVAGPALMHGEISVFWGNPKDDFRWAVKETDVEKVQ